MSDTSRTSASAPTDHTALPATGRSATLRTGGVACGGGDGRGLYGGQTRARHQRASRRPATTPPAAGARPVRRGAGGPPVSPPRVARRDGRPPQVVLDDADAHDR